MRIFKTLDRYVLGEFFLYLVFGVTLVVVFLMVNLVLFDLLPFAIEKQVPLDVFLKILFYQIPQLIVYSLPMATLFASLISISRMSRDSEIDVLRTSGIHVLRILMPVLLGGLIVSAFGGATLQKLVPWSNNQSLDLWRQFQLSDVTGKLMENVFFKGKDNKTFYIRSVDGKTNTVLGVYVYDTSAGRYPRVTTAPRGTWQGDNLELKDGVIHHFKDDGHLDYEVSFESLELNIERHLEQIYGEQKTPHEMTFGELKKKINLFKKSGIDTQKWETDMQFKISIPVASFICVLVGVPLSIRTGRSGMMTGALTAFVTVILYWVMTIVFTALGYKGLIPPFWAGWTQNFVFLAIGIILIARTRK